MGNTIVLFEVTVKNGRMDDYLKMVGSLKESLANAEGFIRAERFSSLATEGKLLSMSVWENEECVSKWRNFAAHRMAQEHGRMNDFADYKITVVTPVRSYTMMNRKRICPYFSYRRKEQPYDFSQCKNNPKILY